MPSEKPTCLILIADGTEEVEAITPGDVLMRCGVRVTYAGVGTTAPTGSNGLPLRADVPVEAVAEQTFDAIVVPGGGVGADNLAASSAVSGLIRRHAEAGKLVASICASPAVVLAPTGVLDGREATCYPGFEDRLGGTITHVAEPEGGVIVSRSGEMGRTVITSRGPGTAMAFSFAVAAELAGRDTAEKVHAGMLVGAAAAVMS